MKENSASPGAPCRPDAGIDDYAMTVTKKDPYPRAGDVENILQRPWRGFEVQMIARPHFGPDPIEVCALRVN